MSPSATFMSGLIVMGFAVAGLFFLKFWSRTRDPLFGIFTLAFWLLALNQALIAWPVVAREQQSWIYMVRLVAFALIAMAVLAKNLARPRGRVHDRRLARSPAAWRSARR